MCGENSGKKKYPNIAAGSPPRVRGKLNEDVHRLCANRITPACAGKTKEVKEKVTYEKDHPRVCGENASQELLIIRI